MSVNLKLLKDCIKRECEKSVSCEECKFNGFVHSICNIQLISDDYLVKFEEIIVECIREGGEDNEH